MSVASTLHFSWSNPHRRSFHHCDQFWDEVPETVPDVSKVYKSRECQGKKWGFYAREMKLQLSLSEKNTWWILIFYMKLVWNAYDWRYLSHFQTHPTSENSMDWSFSEWPKVELQEEQGFQSALRLVQVEISRAGVWGSGFGENCPHQRMMTWCISVFHIAWTRLPLRHNESQKKGLALIVLA